MKKEMLKPSIRFEGFTEAWEQCKVGEIITEKYRPVELLDDKYYQLVTVKRRNEGIVSRGKLLGRDILVKNYYEVCKGDYVISKRQLIHGANGVIPSELDKAVVSNEYMICVSNDTITASFLGWLSKTQNLKRDFFLSSYGVDVEKMVFNVEDWKKRYLTIPSIDEQNKIIGYLDELDNLITFHQRKYDKLIIIKKSMLKKMFPQIGSNVPEIRFEGFTEAWEQRKVSEVAEIIGGGTPSTNNSEYWDGDIDWYAPAEIGDKIYVDGSERKITKLGLEKSSAKMLPADRTVLFTSRAGIGKAAILRKSACTNQGFQSMVLNDDTNPYFVFSMTDMIKDKAERVASGSTFAEISGKMLGNLEFMFPSKAEQDKIGSYFEQMDNLITLHQRKLEKLKKIKKSMLEKMFV